MITPDLNSLSGVEETMLLPLWGRYSESVKSDGLIHDDKCIEIVNNAGLDFSAIARQQNPASRFAWVARAWNVDRELRRALDELGPEGTVVSVGAGLDTSFFRLGMPRGIEWFDLDLPEVISLRERLIGEVPHCHMVSGSALDTEAFNAVRERAGEYPLVVLAVGVLYYFTVEDVRQVFKNIAGLQARTRIIIDYCSPQGVALANQIVIQNCSGARMIWAVEQEQELMDLHPGIDAVETYPLFHHIAPLLANDDAAMAVKSDQLQIMSFGILDMASEREEAR